MLLETAAGQASEPAIASTNEDMPTPDGSAITGWGAAAELIDTGAGDASGKLSIYASRDH